MTETAVFKPGDVIWTINARGETQEWIVKPDGILRPVISGAKK